MLKLYMDRADIKDGHEVLDLGCGWGSFSLYVAERYPEISITSALAFATPAAIVPTPGSDTNFTETSA